MSAWCASCAVTRMAENNSKVIMPPSEHGVRWVIISGTKYQAHHALSGKLCDYVAKRSDSGGPDTFAVLELKSRVQHVGSIVEQLQAGLNLLTDADVSNTVAVLVHARGLNAQEVRALARLHVTLRGRRMQVIRKRSPLELVAVWPQPR